MAGLRDRLCALLGRGPSASEPAEPRRGTGAALFGAGALELQALLQPDRKVEIVLEQFQAPDRLEPAHRPDRPSDP